MSLGPNVNQVQADAAAIAALLNTPEPAAVPPAAPGSAGSEAGGPVPPTPPAQAPAPVADPSAPVDPNAPPAQEAAPLSDAQVFGEVQLPWESPDTQDLDATPSSSDGLSEADIAEVKALIGGNITNDEAKKLHSKIFLGSSRGRRYHEAFKMVRDLGEKIGRDVTPELLESSLRSAATMDELLGTLRQGGPDGARQVMAELTRRRNGDDYPWAEHVRSAARDMLAPEMATLREQAASTEYDRLYNLVGARAAAAFRNKQDQQGSWYFGALNVLHFLKHGESYPEPLKITKEGQWEPRNGAASAASGVPAPNPAPAPGQPASADPEKERLRQELERYRQGELSSAAESWGAQASDVISSAALSALAPLKLLADSNVILPRAYEAEITNYENELWQQLGPEVKRIGAEARKALNQNDKGRLDFLHKQLQQATGRAVKATYVKFLSPYRDAIVRANGAAAQTQQRQVQAGEKTEATAGGGPSSPVVTPRFSDGTKAGDAAHIRSLLGAR